MSNRSIAASLLLNTILSAVFQVYVLAIATRYGGAELAGEYSFVMAIATAISVFIYSDIKSLTLTYQNDCELVGSLARHYYVTTVLSAVVCIAAFLLNQKLFSGVFLYRVAQSLCDFNTCRWQSLKNSQRIWTLSLARFFILMFVLYFAAVWLSFLMALVLCSLSLFIFSLVEFRQLPSNALAIKNLYSDSKLFHHFVVLSISSVVNAIPQVITRQAILFAAGVLGVGLYSISYQVFLASMPVVTIVGQLCIAKDSLTTAEFYKGMVLTVIISLVTCIAAIVFFVCNPFSLREALFPGVSYGGFIYFVCFSIFSILIYTNSFLGFVSVKVGLTSLQLRTGLYYIFSLIVVSVLGFVFSNPVFMLILLFAIATAVRTVQMFFLILMRLRNR
ncbi:hypothetical protein [Chitinibacter sp. GC72]|uniref:hypothetical protein n=1 Tax=Chitinibacter sp. GC72 TaxID=1526917 RepID=UPI0012F8FF53|nr:hypothetical protein [Chitinibacter sp. GC72]